MAPAIQKQNDKLARILIYGQDKTCKTWWALKSAEAGFNTILLNADDGDQIVRMIAPEAQKKIHLVNIVNTLTRAVAAEFVAQFLKDNSKFIWNEQKQDVCARLPAENTGYIVNKSLLTANDVVVFDSHSAIVASTMFRYSLEKNIDLTDAAKQEWDGFNFQKMFLDFMLLKMHGLPCHVILIGHETVHEKRSADGKTVLSRTVQPLSSSNPHGSTIGKNFHDVLYFQRKTADKFIIDAGGSQTRMGGSRNLAPKIYNWEDCPPKVIFDKIHAVPDPDAECRAFTWVDRGEREAPKAPLGNQAAPSAAAAKSITLGVAAVGGTDQKKPSFMVKK